MNELGGYHVGDGLPVHEESRRRFITGRFNAEDDHAAAGGTHFFPFFHFFIVRNNGLNFNKLLRGTSFFTILITSLLIDWMPVWQRCATSAEKKPVTGNNISHAHNLTRRRWEPNLQNVRAKVGGRTKRLRVCTTCIKSNRVMKAA